MRRIYLDNAATTPLLPQVKEFIKDKLDLFGNPSSPHQLGIEAREALEKARNRLADLLGVKAQEVIFTSCATEGNNAILRNVTGGNVVVSAIEHKSVSEVCKVLRDRGVEIREARVSKEGVIDLENLYKLIDKDTVLVSVMAVSNEFGTVQPIEEIANMCEEKDVPFHTDGVQALGKVPLDLKKVSYGVFSGHKFHAPKGVGFMVVKEYADFEPLLLGGGQERGMRSGTENLLGVLAMAKAGEIVLSKLEENFKRIGRMRDDFEKLLKERISGIKIVGENVERSPYISTILFNLEGWKLVEKLSSVGVFCSSGSACFSGKEMPNTHLLKMGYSPIEAMGMVRFSFGLTNTEEEVFEAVDKIYKAIQ
ncbi:MAG: cysteine desulfurase [Aquificae bacterium]|nr:cysteine desulfurase [Aquificota bacterium]